MAQAPTDDPSLIGAWSLAVDGKDGSGHGYDAIPRGEVSFGRSMDPRFDRPVARFPGGAGRFEIAAAIPLGDADFSLTAWVRPAMPSRTTIGDVAAMFDADERRGFSLGFQHSSPCGNHGNDRTVAFGIDAGTDVRWIDHRKPGPAVIMVCGLASLDGEIYAATWDAAPAELGHVYRLAADRWIDCGSPGLSNAVSRLAVSDGRLYAGTSRLRGGGSGMPDSTNQEPGGRVFRYEGGRDWSDLGQLPDADSVAGLVPFDGELYAIPMYSEGLFRFAGAGRWVDCGTPGRRLLALGVHEGALYGAGNDHADVDSAIAQTAAGIVVPARAPEGGGGVFRYDDARRWTSLGLQPETTQVYSIETYGGRMFIGTWPHGLVFMHEGGDGWQACGRLGGETEVMNLLAYNGKLYGGTLPGAQVHRFDGDGRWTLVGTLDRTPNVRYRRAASMVVARGRLFVGTLPSGSVHSMAAGLVATDDRTPVDGWRHVAAVRAGRTIALHVDGFLVARDEAEAGAPTLDLGSPGPLVLGGGPRAGFDGEIADVRLYRRALDGAAIHSAMTMA